MSTARNRRRTHQRKALAGKIMDKLGRERHDMGGYTLPKDVPDEVVEELRRKFLQRYAGADFQPLITFY